MAFNYLERPATQYLDRAATELVTIKSELRTDLSLRTGHHFLDVGCGTGADVLAMSDDVGAGGRAVGVDVSPEAVAEARRRATETGTPAEFTVADAQELPFPPDTFDACRAERMLQHVADPGQAVAEMLRVTRPGGRIAAADPDHGMWAPDLSDPELTRTILAWWFGHIRNPWMGRRLPGLFEAAGATGVRVEIKPVVLAGLAAADAITGIGGAARLAAAQGVVTPDEAAAWQHELVRRDADGSFRMFGAIVAVGCRKERR